MARFLERQKSYTAFRHNLAICAQLHRHAENVPHIPSYLTATYAARLEHCVNAKSATETAYRWLVEARNKELHLAEEDVSLWKTFVESHFQEPIVDHEDVIRPVVFANLLVADMQHGREALEKVISSVNTALFEHPYSTQELLQYHLAPEQVRQMAKNIEFWDVRAKGIMTRSQYREEVSQIVVRLKSREKKGLWDAWCTCVTLRAGKKLLDEHAVSPKPANKKKRKKRGKKKVKSAQVQDTQLNSVMDPKNIDGNDTSHVQASEILSEDETTDEESVQGLYSSTPSVEQSQPLGQMPERESRCSSFADVILHEKLRKERLKATKRGFRITTDALQEDTKLPVSQEVTANNFSAAMVSGHADRDSRQQSSKHARHNLASQETQENETSHVSAPSFAKEEHTPEHQPSTMQQKSVAKPTDSKGAASEAASVSLGAHKRATLADDSSSDAQKGILLSILQSHTIAKDKAASEPVQDLAPLANKFSPPTQNTSTPLSTSYTIFKNTPTTPFPSTTTNPDPHPADDEITLPHASHLLSLSLVLLSHSRSPPLPSPLSEIFSASTTSINAWLDTPLVWHDAAIAAALHEEVEVLQDVRRRYGELGEARRGVESSGGAKGSRLWNVYKGAVESYRAARRELGRRVPEHSGHREIFLKMLEAEEAGRLGEVVGRGMVEDDGVEEGEWGKRVEWRGV